MISLLRSLAIPFERLRDVFRSAFTAFIHEAEFVLGRRIPLLGC
jgi:hypothetical protein